MINRSNASSELFKLRCKYGKTQQEVADGSSISKVTINRIETGKVISETLRAMTFFKLNEYFEKLGE